MITKETEIIENCWTNEQFSTTKLDEENNSEIYNENERNRIGKGEIVYIALLMCVFFPFPRSLDQAVCEASSNNGKNVFSLISWSGEFWYGNTFKIAFIFDRDQNSFLKVYAHRIHDAYFLHF